MQSEYRLDVPRRGWLVALSVGTVKEQNKKKKDNVPAVLTFSAAVNGCVDVSPSRMSLRLVGASTLFNPKKETNGIVPQEPTITQHGKLIKR